MVDSIKSRADFTREFVVWLISKFYQVLRSNSFSEFIERKIDHAEDKIFLKEIFECNKKISLLVDTHEKDEIIKKLETQMGEIFPKPCGDLDYESLSTILLELFQYKYQTAFAGIDLLTFTIMTDYLSGFQLLLLSDATQKTKLFTPNKAQVTPLQLVIDYKSLKILRHILVHFPEAYEPLLKHAIVTGAAASIIFAFRKLEESETEFWQRIVREKINETPALHYAIFNSADTFINIVLEKSIDLEFFDQQGNSVLHAAVINESYKRVTQLLPYMSSALLNHCNLQEKTAIGTALQVIDGLSLAEDEWERIQSEKDELELEEIAEEKSEQDEVVKKITRFNSLIDIIDILLFSKLNPTFEEMVAVKNYVSLDYITLDAHTKKIIQRHEGERRYTFGTRATAFGGFIGALIGVMIHAGGLDVVGLSVGITSGSIGILALGAVFFVPYKRILELWEQLVSAEIPANDLTTVMTELNKFSKIPACKQNSLQTGENTQDILVSLNESLVHKNISPKPHLEKFSEQKTIKSQKNSLVMEDAIVGETFQIMLSKETLLEFIKTLIDGLECLKTIDNTIIAILREKLTKLQSDANVLEIAEGLHTALEEKLKEKNQNFSSNRLIAEEFKKLRKMIDLYQPLVSDVPSVVYMP